MTQGKRKIDLAIDIEADADTVWTAISDAEQLRRWFPLDAEVEPGEGGSVTLSWGPDVVASAPIEVWEPGRRLVWVESAPGDGEDADPVRVAVDLRIEAKGGTTRLRLVHSGFSGDESWDEYIDTLDSGWRYFLFNLKHYLERHLDRPRTMVWDRSKVEGDKEEIWARVAHIHGLDAAAGFEAGDEARMWGRFPARVVRARPPLHLVLEIEALDDALLLVELEPGSGRFSLGTWLSLYGDAGARGPELEALMASAHAAGLPAVGD